MMAATATAAAEEESLGSRTLPSSTRSLRAAFSLRLVPLRLNSSGTVTPRRTRARVLHASNSKSAWSCSRGNHRSPRPNNHTSVSLAQSTGAGQPPKAFSIDLPMPSSNPIEQSFLFPSCALCLLLCKLCSLPPSFCCCAFHAAPSPPPPPPPWLSQSASTCPPQTLLNSPSSFPPLPSRAQGITEQGGSLPGRSRGCSQGGRLRYLACHSGSTAAIFAARRLLLSSSRPSSRSISACATAAGESGPADEHLGAEDPLLLLLLLLLTPSSRDDETRQWCAPTICCNAPQQRNWSPFI